MNGERFEEANSFKYVGTIIFRNGEGTAEVLIRNAMVVAIFARLQYTLDMFLSLL
ncbi:hypothetical protein DPMN_066137 [Dreissena polymorpha]|uniref:Uncharacterized protein n=1 Tax=Dreissena polymorpha TaxID=45954 RepID=A0A9D3YSX6_DREPO|nr:hypothetical protein DPMN_066137 [Dreissena polymorpha]